MPFDLSLTKALGAGLEDEGVGAQLVVWRDGAIFTAAARILNHHRNREGDTAHIFWQNIAGIKLQLPYASGHALSCPLSQLL